MRRAVLASALLALCLLACGPKKEPMFIPVRSEYPGATEARPWFDDNGCFVDDQARHDYIVREASQRAYEDILISALKAAGFLVPEGGYIIPLDKRR